MNKTKDFYSEYHVHRLLESELVTHFDCGDDDLNEFIIKDARLYRQALLAVTYVLAKHNNPNHVVAFFSLANDRVSMSDFENKTDFNRFRKHRHFPQEKRLKSYPAVKICRLGVDLSMKGLHVGSSILDFIKQYFTIDNKTGCRFITVDAYLDAIPFYEKNGFHLLNTDDEGSAHTRLLYFDLNDIV